MNTNQLSQRRRNPDKVRRYFDPNAVYQGGGVLQLHHPINAPVWMLKDILPADPMEAQGLQALLQHAVFYVQHILKQRDEDVPIPNITADVWNTMAVLYAAGKIDEELKSTVGYLDAIDQNIRLASRSDYSQLMGVEDPSQPVSLEPFQAPIRITEEEVAEYIHFLQQAQNELMQRYYAKKQGLMQTEQQLMQQRMEQGGEGVAKQLGLDTGQPLPMAEYGGATFRHKR